MKGNEVQSSVVWCHARQLKVVKASRCDEVRGNWKQKERKEKNRKEKKKGTRDRTLYWE